MSTPIYPTREGLWSEGSRNEKGFEKIKLGKPFKKAVENLEMARRDRDDFDPSVLFVWGTMQAKAVLNILKSVEKEYGAAGQELARKSINEAGYEAAKGMLEDSVIPEDLNEMELISFIVTGINTILYASLEQPWISSDSRCEFNILWCPHQDIYSAFDCRAQRYFVEGMLKAMEEELGVRVHPVVDKLIPRGGDCCHFTVDRIQKGETHPWNEYSKELQKRALEKLEQDRNLE
jgi:hypothetical protein